MPFKNRGEQLKYLRRYAFRRRNFRTTLMCECGQLATTLHCGQPSCERCKLLTEQATAKLKQINCQV